MKISIKQTGILNTKTDVIVNAANANLAHGGGVCGVIFNAAGAKELSEACDKIGYCKTGDAVLTPGFNASKYIIHAVGPIYYDGKHDEEKLLYSCYQKSLDLALKNNCKSITFPLISAGIYGYPVKEAFEVALKACIDWDKNEDLKIIFAIPEDYKYEIGIESAKRLNINLT